MPEKGQPAALGEFDEAALMDGDVTVAVEYSTVNYKDGLAITGKAPVVRRFPMIPGIDFAGKVESSSHPGFKPGDSVVLNGWGTGETHLGAYAAKSRVKGDWLVKLPDGMSTRDAMAIGTAGYTAMLCVIALERHGVKPGEADFSGTSRFIAWELEAFQTDQRSDVPIYAASNAFWEPLTIELPIVEGKRWYRVVDTSLPVSEDIVPEEQAFFLPEMTYVVRPRSTIVFVAR